MANNSDNPAGAIAHRIAKTHYVVLMRVPKGAPNAGTLTLLADPGLSRPWAATGPNTIRNKRVAEFMAKDCDGMACTYEEALKLLIKENPGFEKELYSRIDNAVKQSAQSVTKAGLVLDKHGKPIQPNDNN